MGFRVDEVQWVLLSAVLSLILVVGVGCDTLESWGFEAYDSPQFECDYDGECATGYFCDDGVCSTGSNGGGGEAVSGATIADICAGFCEQEEQCYGADPSLRTECEGECIANLQEAFGEMNDSCATSVAELDTCFVGLNCQQRQEQDDDTHDHCAVERAQAEEQCAPPATEEHQQICDGVCQINVQCFDEDPDEVYFCSEECPTNLAAWHEEQDSACVQADIDWWDCLMGLSCAEIEDSTYCADEAQTYEEHCE